MLRRYHPQFPRIITLTPPCATGEGIDIAVTAGARMRNTDLIIPMPGGLPDARSDDLCVYWVMLTSARPAAQSGDIWVNRAGRRFIREDEPSPDLRERAIMEQPGLEMTCIFDEPMRQGLTEHVRNRTATQIEVRNPPAIVSAPTIAGLGERLALPADALV
jgi:fumarate reductase flavoprotein subunit